MIDRILLLASIFATAAFGTMTLVIGYRALQTLTRGRIKDYGTRVWYALIFFSLGGALHTVQELFSYESIMGVEVIYFEYFFYAVYYIVLLFAIFSIYRMSKFIGFNRRSQEMMEAMKELKGEEGKQ